MNTPRTRQEAQRFIALNRKARHDYMIKDTWETGIVLTGTEVKSLRAAQASLAEAYASEKDGNIFLWNLSITPYGHAGAHLQHDPKRPKLLLLHRREVHKILGAIRKEGMTLVPLALYFNPKGKVKVELGLAKGKKTVDKREAIKARDWQREKARVLKDRG